MCVWGGGQDVMKVINDIPIHYLQDWIFGGLVVLDALTGGSRWPGGILLSHTKTDLTRESTAVLHPTLSILL